MIYAIGSLVEETFFLVNEKKSIWNNVSEIITNITKQNAYRANFPSFSNTPSQSKLPQLLPLNIYTKL